MVEEGGKIDVRRIQFMWEIRIANTHENQLTNYIGATPNFNCSQKNLEGGGIKKIESHVETPNNHQSSVN